MRCLICNEILPDNHRLEECPDCLDSIELAIDEDAYLAEKKKDRLFIND